MKIGLAVIVGAEINLIDDFIEKNKLPEIFSEVKFMCDITTDGTYKKLKEYEAKYGWEVFSRALNFNFSEQRNHLNNVMVSEYIMRLDVDEVINEELSNWIRAFDGNRDAYTIKRQEKFEGELKTYTDIIFLYKNAPEVKWVNRLHEVVVGIPNVDLLDGKYLIIHDKDGARCERQNRYYYDNFEEQRRIVDN